MRRGLLLLALGLATLAGAEPRTAAAVAESQRSFEAVSEQLRKRLASRDDLDKAALSRLADLRFVYERSALPQVRHAQRAGMPQLVVSDGWATLTLDLLQAQALGRPGCFRAFAHAVLPVVRENQRRAQAQPRPPLRAWPRLADYLDEVRTEPGQACAGLSRSALRRPANRAAAAAGMEAAWAWLLAREVATLLPLPAAARTACADRDADVRGAEWADAALHAELARAGPAVLAHAWLQGTGGAPRACISGHERLVGFAARHLSHRERQELLAAWPS